MNNVSNPVPDCTHCVGSGPEFCGCYTCNAGFVRSTDDSKCLVECNPIISNCVGCGTGGTVC